MSEDLLDAARGAREHAHAPYSGFLVGAAVLAGGRIFTGVNVENASYPLSVCAERNAVAAAVIAGERQIDAVAIFTDAPSPTPPCGGCRQVLVEFSADTVPVSSATLMGDRTTWILGDLLPSAFRFER